VALCLDLTLRREGHTTLDVVMRALFLRCKGGPMREQDLREVLQALAGRSFDAELDQWVHSTDELPLQALLEHHGVTVHDDPAQLAQRLGLRVAEANGINVKAVLRGGAAEQAGFCANDEWLGVEVGGSHWRLHKLDELTLVAGPERQMWAWVARDKRMLRLPLTLPQDVRTWRLAVRDAAVLGAWLAPAAVR